MIVKLTGILDEVDENYAVIDVAGVGYQVFCSSKTLDNLPVLGGKMVFYIERQQREDATTLFGFLTKDEKKCFKLLSSVQGVGGKVALAILSALDPMTLGHAIGAQDKTMLTRADGVGPKLAARIATELKDKADQFMSSGGTVSMAPVSNDKDGGNAGGVTPGAINDAVSALTNLGYGRTEAHRAVQMVMNDGAETAEDMIKSALKELAI